MKAQRVWDTFEESLGPLFEDLSVLMRSPRFSKNRENALFTADEL